MIYAVNRKIQLTLLASLGLCFLIFLRHTATIFVPRVADRVRRGKPKPKRKTSPQRSVQYE
jgi:hypothetical protein